MTTAEVNIAFCGTFCLDNFAAPSSFRKRFRVIATKSDPKTGFDGMAVAPIVNGRVDYKNVAVVAAGADPNSKTNSVGPLSRDVVNALYPLSPQYEVADQFVKEIKDNPKYEVTQLTGYSQGSNSQMKI